MKFFNHNKTLIKLQSGFIAIVLALSIFSPGYVYGKDGNPYFKKQEYNSLYVNRTEYFFNLGKVLVESFNFIYFNLPTYDQWYKKYITVNPSYPIIVPPTPSPTKTPSSAPGSISEDEKALLDLVNNARLKANLKPLEYDIELANVAMIKAKDMVDNNYFDHTSPTYGSPFDMMKSFGIKYGYAGENIATGYANVQDVFNGWMNSPGHKANILNEKFTHCGFGIANGGKYGGKTWVQMFIGKP
ncbi:CAP domain-containing protein [Acetivibrio clariflavus]|uniref:Uncharacterized protein, YkwD family n=1 Tax=Acetivibrio clariflavus (strain DSM 19732 / NBRC 101661 / EBR45) TaxID=720554 RepID=G8M1P5_ACECE|nr:CAP domain-containing protein [Acetivibrio clariflavus]AEV70274.1 uncharacterized protein, YkwD family [Acetivibrio clariflavus DSM 19732]HOQ01489.1 CAP domain-containing protein [Acetivibrio clariflavus]HPU41458.1 CAP domain-containing protein [Acetivibrio clariflavus]